MSLEWMRLALLVADSRNMNVDSKPLPVVIAVGIRMKGVFMSEVIGDPSQDPYVRDAAFHLRPIVNEWEWSEEAGVGLIRIIQIYEFVFVDGFVLNGDDPETVVGVADACAIVAAISSAPEGADWKWWSRRASTSRGLRFEEGFVDDLVRRIASHSTVAHVRGFTG